MQGKMALSVWLFEHHHATDVVAVLAPDGYTPTKQEVMDATGIDVSDDEYLDHVQNFPLDAAALADPTRYDVPVIQRPAAAIRASESAEQTVS